MTERIELGRIRLKLAVDPGQLNADGEWHALRLGKVFDPDTGAEVTDVTDELCADIATAFETFGERMPTVLGRDHGLFRAGGDKQSRGVVTGMRHAEGEGLHITTALNALGRGEVEAEEGALWLSPTIFGPAYDPDTGELVSNAYCPEITLTPTPRQTRLAAVALSRGGDAPVQMVALARYEGDDGSARLHEIALEAAARAVLAAMGITPKYVTISDWSDSSATVNAWRYGDDSASSYDKYWSFDYADGANGPVLTNPTEVVRVWSYQPAPAPTTLSRANGAPNNIAPVTPGEETPMDPLMVELARGEHEALLADRTELATLREDVDTNKTELSRLKTFEAEQVLANKTELAKAFADELILDDEGDRAQWVQAHIANPEQAKLLSRPLRRKIDDEAKAFGEALLSRGVLPADEVPLWVDRFKADPVGIAALAKSIPDGATVATGTSPGSGGRGDPVLSDEEQAKAAAGTELSRAAALQEKNPGLTMAAALSQVRTNKEEVA